MKQKKGFTLTELLATIVILSLIAAIAVPSVLYISSRLQNNMYCTKIEVIENDAKLWGQDNMGLLQEINDGQTYNNVTLATSKITIQTLINGGYIKEDDLENNLVLDPRTSESINNAQIVLFIRNKRVYATIPSAIEDCD